MSLLDTFLGKLNFMNANLKNGSGVLVGLDWVGGKDLVQPILTLKIRARLDFWVTIFFLIN